MNRHIRFATLLFSAALAVSVPSAASLAQTRSIKVHSFDLDLVSAAGRVELQHRIQRAVDQVCGPAVGAGTDNIATYASCRKAALANAMSQFDVMVSAAHDGKVAADQSRDVIVR